MTSPLPPKRRDSVNLANLLRQDRQRLSQLDRGLVGGRFPGARILKPHGLGDGDEDDFDADDEIAFQNADRAAATAVGQIVLNLTYAPIDGSLHIRWNGLDQPPTEWSLNGQRVTFNEPHVKVGDVLSAAYAYYPNDAPDVSGLFDERMADGPIAYYRLGETSGTDVLDSSGHDRHGYSGYVAGYTLGQTSLDSSSDNPSVGLDGSTVDVSIAPAAPWMDVSSITVVGLIKPTTLSGTRVVAARDNNGTVGPWRLWIDAGLPKFVVWIGGVAKEVAADTTIATGARHDLAGTFDGNTVRICIDGRLAGSLAATGSIDTNTAQRLWIGRFNAGSSAFGGQEDELAIYDHALSTDRLLAHAKAAGVA